VPGRRYEGRTLSGYEIGLKDNIAVAGIPMTCGSRILDSYVPGHDATIVTRLLDAGGTITGKLNMEDLAFGSKGDLSATGPVLNPRDSAHLAGGSSSGSAAAVVSGAVDVAIECDQGGSVRMPAAWCGCVGLKPTCGLVPYTGIVGAGHTYDHAGPMTTTVAECALVLNVIAGEDPGDPRQGGPEQNDVPTQEYRAVLESGDAITVGVVEEGFGFDHGDLAVDETILAALDDFSDAEMREISIPTHHNSTAIYCGIVNEEVTAVIRNEGVGHFVTGWYDTQFAEAFAQARRIRANEFPPTLKLRLIVGQYMAERYRSHYHAKAQNLRHDLTQAYDDALADVDVLTMPTVVRTAIELDDDLTRRKMLTRPNENTNTSPFNVTGHPAISVPCGTVDGLPVGLMFVGDRFDDATVLRVAHAFEHATDWQEL